MNLKPILGGSVEQAVVQPPEVRGGQHIDPSAQRRIAIANGGISLMNSIRQGAEFFDRKLDENAQRLAADINVQLKSELAKLVDQNGCLSEENYEKWQEMRDKAIADQSDARSGTETFYSARALSRRLDPVVANYDLSAYQARRKGAWREMETANAASVATSTDIFYQGLQLGLGEKELYSRWMELHDALVKQASDRGEYVSDDAVGKLEKDIAAGVLVGKSVNEYRLVDDKKYSGEDKTVRRGDVEKRLEVMKGRQNAFKASESAYFGKIYADAISAKLRNGDPEGASRILELASKSPVPMEKAREQALRETIDHALLSKRSNEWAMRECDDLFGGAGSAGGRYATPAAAERYANLRGNLMRENTQESLARVKALDAAYSQRVNEAKAALAADNQDMLFRMTSQDGIPVPFADREKILASIENKDTELYRYWAAWHEKQTKDELRQAKGDEREYDKSPEHILMSLNAKAWFAREGLLSKGGNAGGRYVYTDPVTGQTLPPIEGSVKDENVRRRLYSAMRLDKKTIQDIEGMFTNRDREKLWFLVSDELARILTGKGTFGSEALPPALHDKKISKYQNGLDPGTIAEKHADLITAITDNLAFIMLDGVGSPEQKLRARQYVYKFLSQERQMVTGNPMLFRWGKRYSLRDYLFGDGDNRYTSFLSEFDPNGSGKTLEDIERDEALEAFNDAGFGKSADGVRMK